MKKNQKNKENLPTNEELHERQAQLIQKLSGSPHEKLCDAILNFTTNAFPKNMSKELALELTYQTLDSIAPKDPIEAMLGSQITSLNAQGMRYLARAEDEGNWLCHTEAAIKMAVKLLRLKNETIETLMRYRRKGEQKVVVQHINVQDDAKAIIGDINGGRGSC